MNQKLTLTKRVDSFLNIWHYFPIDYWWRKKYNVPFGSSQHREMNFIDMFIEYREELLINSSVNKIDDEENKTIGLTSESGVKVTQQEIDDDFENLDLEQFDKK